jgi:hypothetical protein
MRDNVMEFEIQIRRLQRRLTDAEGRQTGEILIQA